MAMSIRDQIAANTANLKPAKDIKSTAKATQPRKPRTAPGMMGALAAAESKIRELEQQGATTEVDVDLIVPNPFQPRRIFDAEKMQELIRNIEEQGLIQPVVLRANPLEEGRYQLVVGERRLRAHIELKRKTIKALIVDLDDVQMSSWALSENMSRSDLSDYEIALGVVACMSNFASRRELAENLGISRSHLYRYFAFQELPDFITDSLNEKPWLLGANAAQDIKSFLNNGAAPELQALAACWPKVESGDIDQLKLVDSARRLMQGSPRRSNSAQVTRLYRKGKVVGHLKKAPDALSFKVKISSLNDEQEAQIRKLMSELFMTDDV